MRTFYYAHTGHRIGLDRFRRGASIIKALGDTEITMLCSDFRIAQVAEEYGVKNSVGVDVVRNIPQIAHHGDRIIFDSDEANPIMLEDMKNFFSTFIHLDNDTVSVDEDFFGDEEKTIKMTYFFGDDDYEKDLEKNLSLLDGLEPHLQLGFYYFLDYEDMLKIKFKSYSEFEEYQETIRKTDILITASPQAVLESLASNGRPIYIKREDYTDDYDNLFKSLNVPIVENYDNQKLTSIVETIDNQNYKKIEQLSNKINKIIKENFNL